MAEFNPIPQNLSLTRSRLWLQSGMRAALICHPATPCPFIDSFEVAFARNSDGTMTLQYIVTGDTQQILLPAEQSAERIDRLWEHTCLEFFVRGKDGTTYCEFNFAPSKRWAAYRFASYRNARHELTMAAPPQIASSRTHRRFDTQVSLPLCETLASSDDAAIALAAVIEDIHGSKSYWALAHTDARPDFHHPSAFTLTLASAGERR